MSDYALGAAIVLSGSLVGIEFCVAVFINPILDRLPGVGGLSARADAARVLGRIMPFWYIATVLTGGVSTALLWASASGTLAAIATVLFASTIVLAVTVLVPINNRVGRWSHGDHPEDWREQVGKWDRWHYLRVVIVIAGFVLLIAAALIPTA
ncbi:DUF1772 domain-containing protein [Paramicrobacterium fandaimingii]|uniref:DUF1772 domain-containing protein n=1 Tax=Paramicrobacterium fandaimingii TaxID=2708079 RepID=UPI001422DD7E|nr:DUF1772 domain-containing protein [Microbacterium fandaimingii]